MNQELKKVYKEFKKLYVSMLPILTGSGVDLNVLGCYKTVYNTEEFLPTIKPYFRSFFASYGFTLRDESLYFDYGYKEAMVNLKNHIIQLERTIKMS